MTARVVAAPSRASKGWHASGDRVARSPARMSAPRSGGLGKKRFRRSEARSPARTMARVATAPGRRDGYHHMRIRGKILVHAAPGPQGTRIARGDGKVAAPCQPLVLLVRSACGDSRVTRVGGVVVVLDPPRLGWDVLHQCTRSPSTTGSSPRDTRLSGQIRASDQYH